MNNYSESVSKFRDFLIGKIEEFLAGGGELKSGIFGFWKENPKQPGPCCCALSSVYFLSWPEGQKLPDARKEFIPRCGGERGFENFGLFFRSYGFDFNTEEMTAFAFGFDRDGRRWQEGMAAEMYLLGQELRSKYLGEPR